MNVWAGGRVTGSPYGGCGHVCNLLLTISSVPWLLDPSRGPVPGARSVVRLGRSDRTFYLLASFFKSSMTQPGTRQKSLLDFETVNFGRTRSYPTGHIPIPRSTDPLTENWWNSQFRF